MQWNKPKSLTNLSDKKIHESWSIKWEHAIWGFAGSSVLCMVEVILEVSHCSRCLGGYSGRLWQSWFDSGGGGHLPLPCRGHQQLPQLPALHRGHQVQSLPGKIQPSSCQNPDLSHHWVQCSSLACLYDSTRYIIYLCNHLQINIELFNFWYFLW